MTIMRISQDTTTSDRKCLPTAIRALEKITASGTSTTSMATRWRARRSRANASMAAAEEASPEAKEQLRRQAPDICQATVKASVPPNGRMASGRARPTKFFRPWTMMPQPRM